MNFFTYLPELKERKISDIKLIPGFHEAGHTIVGYILGCTPQKAILEVDKNGNWIGHTNNSVSDKNYEIRTLVTSAGFYAQAFLTGKYDFNSARCDIKQLTIDFESENDFNEEDIYNIQKKTVNLIVISWIKIEVIALKLWEMENPILLKADIESILNNLDLSILNIKYPPTISV